MVTINCVFCGAIITAPNYAYRKVTGFVKKRDQGGANALRLREVTDTYACVGCIEVPKGQRRGQEGLGL